MKIDLTLCSDSVRKLIEAITQYAHRAPSGGNAQPWKLTLQSADSTILKLVLNIDEAYRNHQSAMDPFGSSSVLALGAFCYNLQCLSEALGFSFQSELQPSDAGSFFDVSAAIEIKKTGDEAKTSPNRESFSSTCEKIIGRQTLRGAYSSKELSPPLKKELDGILECYRSYKNIQPSFFSRDSEELKFILPRFWLAECIRWKNPFFFKSLLSEISIAPTPEPHKIHLQELELSIFDQITMKALKRLRFYAWLSRKYFFFVFALKNLKLPMKSSAGLLYFEAPSASPQSWFDLGFVYAAVWTLLNSKGMACQPVSLNLIFQMALGTDPSHSLSEKEVLQLKDSAAGLRQKLNLNLGNASMSLRIGEAALKPASHSTRAPLKIF